MSTYLLNRRFWSAALVVALLALTLTAFGRPAAADTRTTDGTAFQVTIENLSDDTALPSPLAPGAWAVHTSADPFFTANTPDRGAGLEGLAEDGGGVALANDARSRAGVSDAEAFGAGPAVPGDAFTFTVFASDYDAALSFATMFVNSNDLFLGPDGDGIPLFDAVGTPIAGDVTDYITLWDAGTEVNEAPGSGPNQPLIGGPVTGAAEGVIAPFTNSTRALPLANGIAAVSVTEDAGAFTIEIENVSAASGAVDTPIAPVFYATHNANWQLFTENAPDFGHGLEVLAEDGSPADLVAFYGGNADTGVVGSSETLTFTVPASADYPYLTLAAMVVATNDAFLAFNPGGIALWQDGAPRAAADVAADMQRLLAVWDAGTEANEAIGVGPHQPMNGGPATGDADPNPNVRRYADATNDLATGFFDLTIEHVSGTTFDITLTNISNTPGYAYPGAIAPLVVAQHNATAELFTAGAPALIPLERLAEDGDPSLLLAQLPLQPGVGMVEATAGPAAGGEAHTVTVTLDPAYPRLSLAAMVVPSNDAFLAFDGNGIALLDDQGNALPQGDIDAAIAAEFQVWDAGTERNQAGGAGPDQAGAGQTMPNQGADEGNGTVRVVSNPDPVWSLPRVEDVIRVTITPLAVSKVIDYDFTWVNEPAPQARGTFILLQGGTFVDQSQNPGVWYNVNDEAWILEFAPGHLCDARIVSQQAPDGTFYGSLACGDGSDGFGYGTGEAR